GGALPPAGTDGRPPRGGSALTTRPRPAGGGPRLHGSRRAWRHPPARLHPHAARHRVPLPLRHRISVPGGAGPRTRALHGGPAHIRRDLAGAVPGRRGPPDGPLWG